jgi:hypothetical protein
MLETLSVWGRQARSSINEIPEAIASSISQARIESRIDIKPGTSYPGNILKTDTLVFYSDASLEIGNSDDSFVAIWCRKLVIQDGNSLAIIKMPTPKTQYGRDGANSSNGANGRMILPNGDGENGQNAPTSEATDGESGGNGKKILSLFLIVSEVAYSTSPQKSPSVTIVTVGGNGGNGGKGGNGGRGGDGFDGQDGHCWFVKGDGVWECDPGPGDGGNAGSGSPGKNGGNAGAGGPGGDVYLIGTTDALNAIEGWQIHNNGGSPGVPGAKGIGGTPGQPGARGSAPWSARPGNPGATGQDGQLGQPSTELGDEGQILVFRVSSLPFES